MFLAKGGGTISSRDHGELNSVSAETSREDRKGHGISTDPYQTRHHPAMNPP